MRISQYSLYWGAPLDKRKWMDNKYSVRDCEEGSSKLPCDGDANKKYYLWCGPDNKDEQGNNICGTYQAMRLEGRSVSERDANKGEDRFQQNVSQTTSTCCPPEAFFSKHAGGKNGRKSQKNVKPDKRKDINMRMMDRRACNRALYGETAHCASEFRIKILLCKSCKCTTNGKRELVRVTNRHQLLGSNGAPDPLPGCGAWFTMVDAGIRNLVTALRKQATECCTNPGHAGCANLPQTYARNT